MEEFIFVFDLFNMENWLSCMEEFIVVFNLFNMDNWLSPTEEVIFVFDLFNMEKLGNDSEMARRSNKKCSMQKGLVDKIS